MLNFLSLFIVALSHSLTVRVALSAFLLKQWCSNTAVILFVGEQAPLPPLIEQ